MLSIRKDEAVQMLQSGWTVRYYEPDDCIQWRSPCGQSSSEFMSESLDDPPDAAVAMARQRQDIKYRWRQAT